MQLDVQKGVTLHVEVLGSGPPVVMLHGLLVGNMTSWYFSAAPELAKKHRVVLFDLRGHGMSTRPSTGYDLETMARDLEVVIDKTCDGHATLVGHSYGAAIALSLAARAPEKIEKLVAVEAPLPLSQLAELDAFLSVSPEKMLDSLPPEIAAMIATGGRRARKFVSSVVALAKETSLLEDLRRAADIADAVLATIHAPLLAVYGTRSSVRSVGARLLSTVPGATLTEIEGGHFLPLEAPAILTPIITRFVDG